MSGSIWLLMILIIIAVIAVLIFTGLWEELLHKILIVIGIIVVFNLVCFIGFFKVLISLGIIMIALKIWITVANLRDGASSAEKSDDYDYEFSLENEEEDEDEYEEKDKKKRYSWFSSYRKADSDDWGEKRTCAYCKLHHTYDCPQHQQGDTDYDEVCSFFEGT